MDPRSHPSRPPSTSLPQGSTPLSSTPISSMPMPQYTMQPQYPVSQPHTLPPLQPHHSQSPAPHSYMGQPYRPDLARYPAATHDVYASSAAPIMPHTTVGSLPPSSFLSHPNPQAQPQPSPHYPPPHNVLPPASSAQTYPQPIAPAPPRDRRSDFSGLPSGAFSYNDGKGSPWMNPDPVAGPNGAAQYAAKEPPRTQVVGSQGRRGILPSVPGRATPVTNGVNGTAKNTTIPAKDADGKFPCPHCNKTYLHAKHLKRHLLRHTGDRPYMCVLCKDTFSRSDILKRHFQKCSLRRGNPTGATHLSHPQAHLKRSQAAAPVKPVQEEVASTVPHPNGLPTAPYGEGHVNGNGMPPARPGYADHQQPMGYPMSSVNGMSRGQPEDAYPAGQHHQRGPWLAAPKQNPYLVQQPGADANGQQLNVERPPIDQVKPPVAQDPKRPVMHGPTPNHAGEIDWTSMFQPGASDGYINPVFPQSMAAGQEPIHAHVDTERKFYPTTTAGPGPQESGMNGLYLASTTLSGDGKLTPIDPRYEWLMADAGPRYRPAC
ncbi:C2H2 transcription factor [Aspergillus heteromorphus CBS 117.55]|uniref:C2H2 transcription factor n=1 Tax=Aspergillus heteromorphus CBS 117.55 TaxID=1448321 RepID=A0A317VLB3_9EURO|nr:C2H2 transcription factor [Aspergillus heteromorphus CBS 117.55]PWY73662.1 C2H2 transcription factor [Aspergillus heteromorphus CBS 117.55]